MDDSPPQSTARATGLLLERMLRLAYTLLQLLWRRLMGLLWGGASSSCPAPRVLALVVTHGADATAGLSQLAENLVWWVPSLPALSLATSCRG